MVSTNIDVNSGTISSIDVFLTNHPTAGMFSGIIIAIFVMLISGLLIKKRFLDEKVWNRIDTNTKEIKLHTESLVKNLLSNSSK